MNRLPVLYVEDDENDIFFLRHAFEAAGITNPLLIARHGQEAMEYFSNIGNLPEQGGPQSLPCLILLDLKMPRISGLELLHWLRHESGLPQLPVVVLSSSAHLEDVDRAYELGANAFVVKPTSVDDRVYLAKSIKDFWLHFVETPSISAKSAL
ncbi:MAG TPA: response regulator [Clostridia bacterium]|nr:response regulator [Clostridia bacterium]